MMNDFNKMNLQLTLNGKQHSITITKDVILLLGIPSHIVFMKGLDGKSIAVRPCEPEEILSLEVPEQSTWTKNTHFRFYSKIFVHELLQNNGYGIEESCKMSGVYGEKWNVVYFRQDDFMEFGQTG
ncbi:MAG: hypothetical protein IKF90_20935 [Parasporobacterium sp.]|nr:hypothetical protein [Parasporobacterium sp.]